MLDLETPEPTLRERRQAAGLTLAFVAARLGVSESYLSRAERGQRRLSPVQRELYALIVGSQPPLYDDTLDPLPLMPLPRVGDVWLGGEVLRVRQPARDDGARVLVRWDDRQRWVPVGSAP